MRFAAAVLLVIATAVSSASAQTVATPSPTAPESTTPPAATPPPAKLDKPPKLLRFVEAEPPAALAERREVSVILTIDVDESGKVVKVDVAQSGGADFDDAAAQAAR